MDSIIGIACDPWGNDDDFDIYLSVAKGFYNKYLEDITGIE